MAIRNGAGQVAKVVLAMGLVVLAVAALVLGVLFSSGLAVDRLASDSQTMLVERALAREYRQMESDIQSASIWTEAYVAIADRDAVWLLENFGDYYARYFDHDVTLVFEAGSEPIYAYQDGVPVDPSSVRKFSEQLEPVLASVRAADRAAMADPAWLEKTTLESAVTAKAAIPVDGVVYLVAGSTVLSDFASEETPGRPHAIVVSGRSTDMLLTSLATDLAIQDPVLVLDTAEGPGVAIAGPAGEAVGRIAWQFARPGAGVQLKVVSAIVVGGLILLVASALLLIRIRTILRDLRSNSEALAASLGDLTVARDAAQEASRAKSQFLASMSHEIRTPLNGVLGLTQSLMLDDLKPEHRAKVELILASGQHLTAVLNDVLDISKIEAGKLDLSVSDSQLQAVLAQAVHLFRPTAEDKGLKLVFDPDPGLARVMRFDKLRFSQCVANLLSNAIKFTPAGTVTLGCKIVDGPDGASTISVSVSDTGIGMSAETVARLFDNFVQADASTTRTYGGSGLGLAISRRLARLMGGDLEVWSEQGKGSTFILTVRAAQAAAPVAAGAGGREARPAAPMSRREGNRLKGARILLVDDNALNRQIVRLFLAQLGPNCVEAGNGREALERLETEPFDLVLLDVHMPVMDGRTCIQVIRSSAEPWSSIPVIALTAEAMTGDREALLACGMTEYVAKPIDRQELLDKVAQCLNGAIEPAADQRSPGSLAPDDDLSSVLDAISTAVA